MCKKRSNNLSSGKTESDRFCKAFERNDLKYRQATEQYVRHSLYTHNLMQEMLNYREKCVNPVISSLIEEEIKYYNTSSQLISRLEGIRQKLSSVDYTANRTQIIYDPCKFIRGRNLIDRTVINAPIDPNEFKLLETKTSYFGTHGYGTGYTPELTVYKPRDYYVIRSNNQTQLHDQGQILHQGKILNLQPNQGQVIVTNTQPNQEYIINNQGKFVKQTNQEQVINKQIEVSLNQPIGQQNFQVQQSHFIDINQPTYTPQNFNLQAHQQTLTPQNLEQKEILMTNIPSQNLEQKEVLMTNIPSQNLEKKEILINIPSQNLQQKEILKTNIPSQTMQMIDNQNITSVPHSLYDVGTHEGFHIEDDEEFTDEEELINENLKKIDLNKPLIEETIQQQPIHVTTKTNEPVNIEIKEINYPS